MAVFYVQKEVTDLEVKINKEIREYTENMFFGLSMRQFFFSVLACLAAVGLYFMAEPYLGSELVSWVCIFGAVPFAVLGFFRYNGMTAEQYLWAWVKTELLIPRRLVFRSENLYYDILKDAIRNREKEGDKTHD